MESEVSIAFGESCSQPPRSPQLSFQQQKNNRNRTNHDRSASHQSLREHAILTPASFDISNSDNELENEDTEFIDNEAYQKVQDSQFLTRVHEQGLGGGGVGSQNSMLGLGSGCSPITSIERGVTNYGSQQRMIEDDDSSKPRFKIKRGGRRGDVFEKVELHHWRPFTHLPLLHPHLLITLDALISIYDIVCICDPLHSCVVKWCI